MESKTINFTDPQNYHDRVLIVGGKKFYVVSGILSQWSEYFRAMFDGYFEEANKKEVELKQIDPIIFEEFLRIIYDSSFARYGVASLIPLINMSFFFMAPKVLDSCKNFVDKFLNIVDSETLVKLLETACEKDLDEMKVNIVKYLKNIVIMKTLDIYALIACANQYNLNEPKDWMGNYLVDRVTPGNLCSWMDYSVLMNLPTLKAGLLDTIITWDDTINQNARVGPASKACIPEENVIFLVEYAFKHNIDVLKTVLRKRIFYLQKTTNKTFNENGSPHTISINTFLENNLGKICALPKDISEFILTSAFRDI